jgi:hypothetical protein
MTYEEQYFKQTNEQKLKAQHMDTIKATLDGKPAVDNDSVYLVDFSKMQRVEDLITVLAAVGFSFSPMHPQFQNIVHLLDLNRPIKIGQPQQTPAKEIKLPKLKAVKKDGE